MKAYSTWDGPPTDAVRHGNLAWIIKPASSHRIWLQMWRGKALKPFANYSFRSLDHANEYIQQQIAHAAQIAGIKAERADKAKVDRDKMAAQLTVGTLLCNSWGYDQTNLDYYEVVERRGLVAFVRPIGSASVPGSDGFMSDQRCPRPGHFIGSAIRKTITANGIQFEHGWTSVIHAWEKNYCSWYA